MPRAKLVRAGLERHRQRASRHAVRIMSSARSRGSSMPAFVPIGIRALAGALHAIGSLFAHAGWCFACSRTQRGEQKAMVVSQRVRIAEIPLADVSPRFEARRVASAFDSAVLRRAWFAIQHPLRQRLQPLFDDGWEVVPSSLGPHSLHLEADREGRRSALPFSDWLTRTDTGFVRSATVLLQRPVHFAETDRRL
jgi:hypothetical protein